MEKTEQIMERAVAIYNANSSVTSVPQAEAIVESLKLFVRAYALENEDNEDYFLDTKPVSMLKPKIMMFIALCNYKIDNINRAYCIAKQGLDEIDYVIENSMIQGVPRSMYGADTFEEIIRTIEEERFNEVTDADNYQIVNPEEIDTSRLDEILGMEVSDENPSKEKIKGLIDAINKIQKMIEKAAEESGDVSRGFKVTQSYEVFKYPLYYAWRGYKYGWHTDFCKEGDSLFQFLMFEAKMRDITNDMINLLREQSPFARVERNSAITNGLIEVYSSFLRDLDNGNIKI